MLDFGPLNGPERRSGRRLSLLAQAEEGWELAVWAQGGGPGLLVLSFLCRVSGFLTAGYNRHPGAGFCFGWEESWRGQIGGSREDSHLLCVSTKPVSAAALLPLEVFTVRAQPDGLSFEKASGLPFSKPGETNHKLLRKPVRWSEESRGGGKAELRSEVERLWWGAGGHCCGDREGVVRAQRSERG